MHQDESLLGVAEPLRANLLARGFTQLTRVQEAVHRAGLEGVDLRITSETGSGKTVAVGMVLAHGWDPDPDSPGPGIMLVTPTRELANQVKDELTWLFRGLPSAEVAVVTGGTSIGLERRALARRPQVLVGTPGRLHDHVRSGALTCAGVRQVVLDEADRMLDMGFRDDLDAILSTMPPGRRTHLVSATFPGPVVALAKRYQANVCHVQGTALGEANSDIEHVVHLVRPQQRFAALVNLLLLRQSERTLVFVRTRGDANDLAEQLSQEGFSVLPLHGDLAQAQRTRTLNAFRAGTVSVLIATDVAARGLDIPSIATVIHFEPPSDPDAYTHRSGRTGRAGAAGRSILLVPAPARARVLALLRAAKVQAQLAPPPSAQQVERTARKAFRRALHQQLVSAGDGWEEQREYAARLLAEHDPVRLVATLLGSTPGSLLTEPRDIAPVEVGDERGPDRFPPRRFGKSRPHPFRSRGMGAASRSRSPAAYQGSARS